MEFQTPNLTTLEDNMLKSTGPFTFILKTSPCGTEIFGTILQWEEPDYWLKYGYGVRKAGFANSHALRLQGVLKKWFYLTERTG